MDEKRYELVEIQVDAELLEQLEAVIAPMGLTPEMLAVKFFEFCVDPATQELAISLLLKWKAEQEAEGRIWEGDFNAIQGNLLRSPAKDPSAKGSG